MDLTQRRQLSGGSSASGGRTVWNVITDGGCVGDDTAFDTVALAAADAIAYAMGVPLYFPVPSVAFKASGTIVFQSPCIFDVGAIIHVTAGSITFNGGVTAEITQILNLESGVTATLSPTRNAVSYAEWYGAVPDDVLVDCTAAINLSLQQVMKTQLLMGTYYHASTIVHNKTGAHLHGAPSGTFTTQQSILSITSSSVTQLTVTVNGEVANLRCIRYVAPLRSSLCVGILVGTTVGCSPQFYNVSSHDHMISWKINRTGWGYLHRCSAGRSLVGAGGGTDSFIGFWCDGTVNTGWFGGNASLYLNRTIIQTYGDFLAGGAESTGYFFDKAFMDVFPDWIECENVTYGIRIVGTALTGNSWKNFDFRLGNSTIEAIYPVHISNIDHAGAITFIGGYLLPRTTGHCVTITNCPGVTTFIGVQYITCNATSASDCFNITNSKNVKSYGGTIVNPAGRIAYLSSSSNCSFSDTVNSTYRNHLGVVLVNSHRNEFAVKMTGGMAGSVGYSVDNASGYNEFNCTGIDPARISGGAANKLVINGTQVTAVGIAAAGHGTNVASGVMA